MIIPVVFQVSVMDKAGVTSLLIAVGALIMTAPRSPFRPTVPVPPGKRLIFPPYPVFADEAELPPEPP